MRRELALLFMALGFGGYLAISSFAPVVASSHTAVVRTIDGTIDTISSGFLGRGITTASDNGYEFLIINLDTPSGTLQDTRDIVELLLASPIPVIVYVSPSGARAASAETFITSAAHVAAMAPTTSIGAASPIMSGGEDLRETIKNKVMEDTAALSGGIARRRDRNSDALERTVLEATSYTAAEALELGVMDIIAEDLEDLLVQLNGRTVQLGTGPTTLKAEGVHVATISKTLVERILGVFANPDIAFLLLTVGGVGLLIEFPTPGLFGPGIIGLIALALTFVALGNMSVNWVGVRLILFAMVLFFLEPQAPGIGIVGTGGAISFILGAFLLFGNLSFSPPAPQLPAAPSVQISLWLLGIVTIILVGSISLTARAMRQAKNVPVYAGATTSGELISQMGQATTDLSPPWHDVRGRGAVVSRVRQRGTYTKR